METNILNKLTEQDIFGLIYMATGGEMCSDNQKNILVRGEIYSIKSIYPKSLIGRVILPNEVIKIKFTDNEIKYYNGKQILPLINISYNKVMQEFIQPTVQSEDNVAL